MSGDKAWLTVEGSSSSQRCWVRSMSGLLLKAVQLVHIKMGKQFLCSPGFEHRLLCLKYSFMLLRDFPSLKLKPYLKRKPDTPKDTHTQLSC